MHYEYERERITEEMKKTISLHKFNVKGLVVSNFLLERERERERERENAPYRRSAALLFVAAPPFAFGILPHR